MLVSALDILGRHIRHPIRRLIASITLSVPLAFRGLESSLIVSLSPILDRSLARN